ncbi:MAG: gamma-glutamylcyclotransferase [Rhodospirillales bacterium]|nr:gamma-glutamylcyclotransferase [Rhodospirillales bacterium]MDE2575520.1 gamma-glutamylcyclotransferase [Rhodospirillales bacterium]
MTRELLLSGGFPALVARSNPGLRLLSDEERAASLAAILAARPRQDAEDRAGVWVFAYGSLIWNPAIHVAERRIARVLGWHRAFCLSVKSGRGTPEKPGLMLGLRPGGSCAGAVLRVAEGDIAQELDLLWRREMIASGYVPRWVDVETPDGAPLGRAIAFTINPDGPAYAGDLSEHEIVRRLATARGMLGSGADYLFQTRDGLRAMGIADPELEALAVRVTEAMSNDLDTTG